jgi:hypothetical protein
MSYKYSPRKNQVNKREEINEKMKNFYQYILLTKEVIKDGSLDITTFSSTLTDVEGDLVQLKKEFIDIAWIMYRHKIICDIIEENI